MTGIPLLITFFLAIVLMIVAISKWKIHPFLSLMGTSLLLAIVVGLPLAKIPGIIGAGFSGTFASIGIVIILGALIGLILEHTGAAIRLADVVIRCVGEKHPQLAMMLMGWIVSIPVFCDSGFVILNPIRKAICKKIKGISPVGMAVALSGGLYTSHVFIPPTPGPIAAAGSLGVADNLAAVILVGICASIPALLAAYLFSLHIAKKNISVKETNEENALAEKDYDELVRSFGQLPGAAASFAPIVIPILLMALGSIVTMAGMQGVMATGIKFLGTPIIALTVGLILAVYLLASTGKMKDFYDVTDQTMKTVGPILFITAAGGGHHGRGLRGIHESQCRLSRQRRHLLPLPDFSHPQDGTGLLDCRDHDDCRHHGHVLGFSLHDDRTGSQYGNGRSADRHGHRCWCYDGIACQRQLFLGCHELHRHGPAGRLPHADHDDVHRRHRLDGSYLPGLARTALISCT